ncbi:MAG: AAA family ATPase, partial [Bacillota bacterium]
MKGDQAEKLRADAVSRDFQQFSPGAKKLPGQCRVIAVSSGKGGVGKTSLVLNLGLSLIKMDYRVVVIDADLGLANLDVMLNVMPRYSLSDVISGEKSLRDIMINGPLDLKIIPGSSGIYDLANLDQVKRGLLLDQLKGIEEEGDYILIDTAAGISRNVLSFIGAADDFILITTPEPTALADAYGMLKVLTEKQLKSRSLVVVNSTRTIEQGY